MTLKPKTTIVLVYDIDVEKIDILEENIKKLSDYGFEVYHIQSIRNFEDELLYSTSLKNINDLYNTKNVNDFKNKFINQFDLNNRLTKVNFDLNRIWTRINSNKPFDKYSNQKSLNLIRKK